MTGFQSQDFPAMVNETAPVYALFCEHFIVHNPSKSACIQMYNVHSFHKYVILKLASSTTLPIGIYPCCFPSGHEGGKQPQNQSRAVKQHVKAIRDQPQTVGPHTIEELHKREGLHKEQQNCYQYTVGKLYQTGR